MVNRNGFQKDGIVIDVNMLGWIKQPAKILVLCKNFLKQILLSSFLVVSPKSLNISICLGQANKNL